MKKRSVKIAGHATSISLEDDFWLELSHIATTRNMSITAIISEIDAQRKENNLSSALRVFVLNEVKRG